MIDTPLIAPQLEQHAQRSLRRLRPRLEARFAAFAQRAPDEWATFLHRLDQNFERLFLLLHQLYGTQYDFFFHLEMLLDIMAQSWIDRSLDLKALDTARLADPHWFQRRQMLGGVCYVDLFAGDLQRLREHIPYFQELGLTYLHLMPLFLAPEGESDGGYAVSSYRDVHPPLGTMEELAQLATDLRHAGISLVLDFVFNHTSNEHEWALRARAGDLDYQTYYRLFPDRTLPDRYEATLREIFPDERPGSFTYAAEMNQWVWTTFHSYQWDLNYANPELFNRMAGEMLFLANVGVEVLRLDAVAFVWKQMGTSCENLNEAHLLIQAYNAIARIAAPALIFKSEAIVHPADVVKYIHPHECQTSYNPLLMALLWEALATRQVKLLQFSMQHRFQIHPDCSWVNYVRSHDDIGWTFSDEDAVQLGINGFDHRVFLNSFYTGQFEGSFARGLPFQFNPINRDMRISGTCASLAGLEQALRTNDEGAINLAIRRILLIHSVILSIGGIPLIYLGDEVGMLNDYGYRQDAAKASDSRWVHRPLTDWDKMAQRHDEGTVPGRIYTQLHHLITLRKDTPVFDGIEAEIIDTGNPHVFGYVRCYENQRLLILANFSEHPQRIPGNDLRLHGLSYTFTDLVADDYLTSDTDLVLEPYRFVWLEAAEE